jgi:hypothetical protein
MGGVGQPPGYQRLPVSQRISRIRRIKPRIPPPMYMVALLYV